MQSKSRKTGGRERGGSDRSPHGGGSRVRASPAPGCLALALARSLTAAQPASPPRRSHHSRAPTAALGTAGRGTLLLCIAAAGAGRARGRGWGRSAPTAAAGALRPPLHARRAAGRRSPARGEPSGGPSVSSPRGASAEASKPGGRGPSSARRVRAASAISRREERVGGRPGGGERGRRRGRGGGRAGAAGGGAARRAPESRPCAARPSRELGAGAERGGRARGWCAGSGAPPLGPGGGGEHPAGIVTRPAAAEGARSRRADPGPERRAGRGASRGPGPFGGTPLGRGAPLPAGGKRRPVRPLYPPLRGGGPSLPGGEGSAGARLGLGERQARLAHGQHPKFRGFAPGLLRRSPRQTHGFSQSPSPAPGC